MTQDEIAAAKALPYKRPPDAVAGAEAMIAPDNQPLPGLPPILPIRAMRVPGSAKGKIVAMASDFADPLTDFQIED
jgi:hypothetical protein